MMLESSISFQGVNLGEKMNELENNKFFCPLMPSYKNKIVRKNEYIPNEAVNLWCMVGGVMLHAP